MNKAIEERTIQALAAVASLAGLSLKKATTGDDLKEFTLTLAFTGVSAGLVQERFDFEREDTRPLVATVNANGEVMDLRKETDPSDLTEKDETLIDPDGGAKEPVAVTSPTSASTTETIVDINSKKRR